MDYYSEEIDDFDDDDEIDLLDLITADTNSTNQYLVFLGSNDEIYAINVSKVRELLVYKELNMVKNGSSGNSLIKATAKIRDDIATIVNFDEWYGNEVLSDDNYELIILAGFGGHDLGIMIKSVEYIMNINPSDMQDNSINNSKTNFIANIKLNGVDRLCTIFDCDKMLLDIFEDTNKKNIVSELEIESKINSNKYVLFADDSKFIRKMVESLLLRLHLKAKIFENGQELLDELTLLKPEEIGLVITDLEMPIMDGNHLIKRIREKEDYNSINIIVHTNMSNYIIESNLIEFGAAEVIGKIDMLRLSDGIKKYFK